MPLFSSLGLSAPLLLALEAKGFAEPTAVQSRSIGEILAGKDVWACAKTGSGKTAAFVLPILERLSQRPLPLPHPLEVAVLVLVPTRELAAQVADAIASLGNRLPSRLKTCVAIGGVSINPQMLELRGGADIVVATPGRLLDLVEHNALRLSKVSTLVLDEADRMLSLGFAEELGRVRQLLPARHQTLLFSATFPQAVQTLIAEWLREPVAIDIDEGQPPDSSAIAQRAIEVNESQRGPLLRHLLAAEDWERVLVFVATKHTTEHLADKLRRHGFSARPLHGKLSQGARTQALDDFKTSRVRVLVATDLAARGLDIVELPAVVNFDLPRSTEDYVHRIGRTGRAGAVGVAVSFITGTNYAHFELIERRHQLSIARESIPGFEPTDTPLQPDPHGGVKGKRKSKKDKLREAAQRTAAAPTQK